MLSVPFQCGKRKLDEFLFYSKLWRKVCLSSKLLYYLDHCLPFLNFLSCFLGNGETQPVQLSCKEVEAGLFGVRCSLLSDVVHPDPEFISYHYRHCCLMPAKHFKKFRVTAFISFGPMCFGTPEFCVLLIKRGLSQS